MSSNIARDTLVKTFRTLLTSDSEEDVKRDFTIEYEDRKGELVAVPVHSSVLTMRY